MPYLEQPQYQIQFWKKPVYISDNGELSTSDAAQADLRYEATQILSRVPVELHYLGVGLIWPRSDMDSMREYQVLDAAAKAIDRLKAINMREREQRQQEADEKKEKERMRKVMKYRVCPKEMQKTRNDMRELRERGCRFHCVEDCMPEIKNIMNGIDGRWSGTPSFVFVMEDMEWIMDAVRATAIELQTDNLDGHWAIDLLNFYSDGWILWLDGFNMTFQDHWYDDIFDENMEGAKQRAKIAKEIVEEVKKEKKSMSFSY